MSFSTEQLKEIREILLVILAVAGPLFATWLGHVFASKQRREDRIHDRELREEDRLERQSSARAAKNSDLADRLRVTHSNFVAACEELMRARKMASNPTPASMSRLEEANRSAAKAFADVAVLAEADMLNASSNYLNAIHGSPAVPDASVNARLSELRTQVTESARMDTASAARGIGIDEMAELVEGYTRPPHPEDAKS